MVLGFNVKNVLFGNIVNVLMFKRYQNIIIVKNVDRTDILITRKSLAFDLINRLFRSQSTRTTKKSRNTNNSRNDQDLERILKESMEDVSGGGGGDSAHFGGGVASVANVASVGGVEGSVEGGTNTTEEEEKLDSFADEVSDLVPVIEDPVHEPPESKVEIEATEKVEPKEEEPIKKIMTPKRSKSSRKPQKKQKHQDSESDRDSFSTHHNKKPVKKLSEMHKRVQNMLDYLQTQKDVCVSEDGGDVWEEGEEELVGEVDEVATLVHDALVRFQQSY